VVGWDSGGLTEVLLVDPLDQAVSSHDSVVSRDDEQIPSSDGVDFDLSNAKTEVSSESHTEGLVLHRLWKSPDLGLEDMSRRGSVHGPPPTSVRQASQKELLLDAGQGNPDPTANTQRGGPEIADQLCQLGLIEGFGCGCRGAWRCRLVIGLNHDGSSAIPTKGPDQSECVIGHQAKVVGDYPPSVTLRQQAVDKGAGNALRETLRLNGKVHGQQRSTGLILPQRRFRVCQPWPT
jgi:hypothetical protein